MVFTSGQIALDPQTGKLVEGGIEEQTRQVLANLEAVLKAGGSTLSKVIKATVFLDDINNFSAVNKVYAECFPSDPPARSAFQVAALPMGAMIEIEMIAMVE
jgi:2-iminobutanoate/2-iminopropanoate deaminase